MKRVAAVACFALVLIVLVGPGGVTAGVTQGSPGTPVAKTVPGYPPPTASGTFDFKDVNFGTGITECPQAGMPNGAPQPLDQREIDAVEQYANGGNDRRTNEEYSCFPQNEPSIDTNPANPQNIVTGINDYRLGTGSSGFAATTNGQRWYSGIIPFPSVNPPGTTQGFLVSGGDPAVVFDRDGVVYYAQITFNRDDDTGGVTVQRSLNGGFTWSRACILNTTPPSGVCGGPGDPRTPGDGVVSFQQDNDSVVNGSIPFDDKEYIAAGPRPTGVAAQCYTPAHAPLTACPAGTPISPDRLYVTWTKFTATDSKIMESHSDDQGRSWSAAQPISGSAAFCVGGAGNSCDLNQYSIPTVSPQNGAVYVSFENFNTPDENQYVVVRSTNGGATWQGPFFVTPVFDLNFPRAGVSGRVDCTARGQQATRIVYTNSCFRSNPGGNLVVDRRGGDFANDLYLVMSDNRNGTVYSSNADVFLFKSIDGGSSWIGPTRVNDDTSSLTAGTSIDGNRGRDCLRPAGFIGYGGTAANPFAAPCRGAFGADQWWPWVDINDNGHLNILFHDRRLDGGSTAHEWPTTRAAPIGRPGNYLVWTWGAQCDVTQSNATQCMAPGAAVIPQPAGPINPGLDPVPGQGASYLGSLHNFGITDVPSNFDYSFRAGIFAGDYNNVAVTPNGSQAYGYFTDARNGRSSGGPAGGGGPQGGRNPICEQADGFMDAYPSRNASAGQNEPKAQDAMFLVTPCAIDD